ncbi:MAG: cyclase [Candidatus Deianiraeaceae bacterium]|jgi:cyclase
MLAKRIIACLDSVNGRVIKGTQFQNHQDIGCVMDLAEKYSNLHVDELVLYNIASSADNQTVSYRWIREISKKINIPFCVAGGIRTLQDAENILNNGADKISINTPALQCPEIIDNFVKRFGSQAVVVGVDTKKINNINVIYQNTGKANKTFADVKKLENWIMEVQDRGAGEIVINSIASDGMKNGYDITLLAQLRKKIKIPLIASGGAGSMEHFLEAFNVGVDGALAASVFHKDIIYINKLKHFLKTHNIPIRI